MHDFKSFCRVSDSFTVAMAEDAATTDAPVIEEVAAMDPTDEATAQVDGITAAGDADEDGGTGVADPEPAQKSPSTAQRAKPKVSKAQHLGMICFSVTPWACRTDCSISRTPTTACCNTARAMTGTLSDQGADSQRLDVEPEKIMSGSRHRKSVAFYQPETIHVTEKLTVEPVRLRLVCCYFAPFCAYNIKCNGCGGSICSASRPHFDACCCRARERNCLRSPM